MSLAFLGFVLAGVAAVAAQVVEHSRAVYGVGLGVLVMAYLLRGIGDVLDNAVTWLSPLGWAEKTQAYGDARWWPLLVPLLVGLALVVAAVVLAGRRDLGSSLLRRGASEPTASALLRTPLELAIRLHRGTVIGWTIAAVITTATFGALAQQLIDAIAGNTSFADVVGGRARRAWTASSRCLCSSSFSSAAYVVQAVGTIRAEETTGRLESTLSGDVRRWRWLGTHAAVVLAGALVVGTLGGLAGVRCGGCHRLPRGPPRYAGRRRGPGPVQPDRLPAARSGARRGRCRALGRDTPAHSGSELVERAQHAERERDQRGRIAAAEARVRIARDMHDVVAHSLSVIVVQADGGRYAATEDPAVATGVAEDDRRHRSRRLAEMHRLLLDVLRPEDESDGRGPQPGQAAGTGGIGRSGWLACRSLRGQFCLQSITTTWYLSS